MAKLSPNSPIRFRGKLSNIVASEWNGIIVLKAAPHWNKKYKATAKQLANQQRFKFANSLVKRFRMLLDLTVQKEPGQTRASSIMSELLREALVGDWPDTRLDYSRLLLAKGTLAPADSPTAKAAAGGRIDFEWKYNSRDNSRDKHYGIHNAILIAVSENSKTPYYDVQGSMRHSLKGSLTTAFKKGEKVHTWISFRTGDFGMKANSVYTGVVKIK